MRIFFASDLHGSDLCFRKLLAARRFYNADVVVLGGDVSGKAVQPIVKVNGRYRTSIFGRSEELLSDTDVSEFEARAARIGLYTIRVTEEELQTMSTDAEYMRLVALRLVRERLERWLELASSQRELIYFAPGNDDDPSLDAMFMASSAIVWIDKRAVMLPNGFVLLGVGGSNYTPWNTPREYSEQELAVFLSLAASQVSDWKHAICSIHVPPFDSGLDLAPELNASLQIRTAPGFVARRPIGSIAVARFLMQYQPLVAMCGHVHESRGQVRLGRTLCINPGSTFQEGTLSGVLVSIGPRGVEDVQFTSG